MADDGLTFGPQEILEEPIIDTQASEPVEPEKKNTWYEDFGKASTVDPNEIGYVPIPLEDQPLDPKGNVYLARSRQENSITNMLDRTTTYTLDDEAMKQYPLSQVINKIPKEILALGYEDRYIGLNPEQAEEMTSKINQELADKSLIAANPWQSFGWGLIDPLDPLTWLFGSKIFKGLQTSSTIGKSMLSSGLSTAGLIGANEVVLQRNQVTRELDESLFNVAAAGIIGSVLGGIGAGIEPIKGEALKRGELDILTGDIGKGKTELNLKEKFERLNELKIRKKATEEVTDVLTGKKKELTEDGRLTDNDIANMPSWVQKTMRLTAMNRMATSKSDTVKNLTSLIYENGYELEKHARGISSDTSSELRIHQRRRDVNVASAEILDLYYEMHGIKKGPFRSLKDKFASEVDMNLDQFNDAMGEVLTTDRPHKFDNVNKAATIARDKIFNPLKDEAIELGMLPEGVTVPNAVNYFMTVYNKNKIIEQGGKSARGPGTFPQYLHEQFTLGQKITKQYKESPSFKTHQLNINKLKDEIKVLKKTKSKIAPVKKTKLKPLEKQIKELNAKIKEIEKLVLEQAPKGAKNADGKLARTGKSADMLWVDVEQTIDNITGNGEGVLLNPVLAGLKSSAKPLKARRLLVDQEGARPWHVTGASQIAEIYSRAMIPAVEMEALARRQGFESFEKLKLGLGKQIKDEYDLMLKGVKGKEAQKITRRRDRDINDVKASFELLQGVYGKGLNVLDTSFSKYYHAVMAWNYTRMLGHMVISSIVDIGNIVTKHGAYQVVHGTLGSIGSIAKEMTKTDLQGMGFAMEVILGSRIRSYSEHTGLSTSPNPLSKGMDSLTQGFGNLSLVNQWNDQMHLAAGIVGINKSLTVIHKIVAGEKVAQKEITRLAQLGVNQKHFETIAKFTDGKIDPRTGSRYADWANWNITNKSEAEALREFQAHIAREIDLTIIVPGLGDKPLRGHTPNGKLFLQFKSFSLASNNRTLYPNIQRRYEAEVAQGYVSMLALGGVAYIVNSLAKGKEPDMSFNNLSREALDKSGILTIWMDIANTTGKVLDIPGVSRYKTRDKWGAVLGPSAGAASDLADILNKFGSSVKNGNSYTTKDAEKIKRLAPLQNIFWWDYAFNEVTKKTATKLGAKPVD